MGALRLYGGNLWEVGGKGICGRESAGDVSVDGIREVMQYNHMWL